MTRPRAFNNAKSRVLLTPFVVMLAGGPALAQDPTTPPDPVVQAAQQDKARSEARTAAYDAAAAEVAARNASLKAAVDALPTSGTTGAVTAGADAGKAEATLLAAKAADLAAERIASAVSQKTNGKSVTVFAGNERPTLDHWNAFHLRMQLLQDAIVPKAQSLDDTAVAALRTLQLSASGSASVAKAELAPVALALGVSALTKLAGLFQTDYVVAGIGLTPDDNVLATAVAGRLAAASPAPSRVSLYSRSTNVAAGAKLLALLTPLGRDSAAAQARIAFLQERAKTIRADAKAKDPAMTEAAAACDQASAAWQLVSTGYDSLLGSLTTADAAGNLPIAKIGEEQRLADALAEGEYVLIVQLNSSLGGSYTKKNILTTLGAEPFFVSAGVVASYVLVSGQDGKVLAASAFPIHGGYHRAPDVAAFVNTPS